MRPACAARWLIFVGFDKSFLSDQKFPAGTVKFDTPQSDGLMADGDASLSQKVFNITMAEIESVVEPKCVADDLRWEPMALVSIHAPILSISGS